MRRAVITGIGLVTPLGASAPVTWRRLLAGASGLRKVEHFRTDDLRCKIAGLVPKADRDAGLGLPEDALFDPLALDNFSKKDLRKLDEFIVYGVAAADEAIRDSGWDPESSSARLRAGVMIGSGVGGLQTISDAAVMNENPEQGPRRLSPFVIPSMLINLVSGHVSIRHGLKGPNHAVVTACATGAHAIGVAARLVVRGDADMMVAGGAEAAVCRLGLAGFDAARALSNNFNDTPKAASRPWDRDRDGFVMGEGAGIVVIEEYAMAKARGANIYGEVVGYGMSGDAYHITSPAEDGDGGYRAMAAALDDAGLEPGDLGYVNAHGTSTPKGDEIELRAIERLFGSKADGLVMSSTKSSIGHLLGAAGSVEAIFTLLALRDQKAPPTLNLDNPSVQTAIDLAPHEAKTISARVALTNSFGFGGTNASVILSLVD